MPASVKSFRTSLKRTFNLKGDKNQTQEPISTKKAPIDYNQTDSEGSVSIIDMENISVIDTIGNFSDAQSDGEPKQSMFAFKKPNNEEEDLEINKSDKYEDDNDSINSGASSIKPKVSLLKKGNKTTGNLKSKESEKIEDDTKSIKSRTSTLKSKLSFRRKSKKETEKRKNVNTVNANSAKLGTVQENPTEASKKKEKIETKRRNSIRESIKLKMPFGKKNESEKQLNENHEARQNGNSTPREENKSITSTMKSILRESKHEDEKSYVSNMSDESKLDFDESFSFQKINYSRFEISSKIFEDLQPGDKIFVFKRLNDQSDIKQEKGEDNRRSIESRASSASLKFSSKNENKNYQKENSGKKNSNTLKASPTDKKKIDQIKRVSSFKESIKSKISKGKNEEPSKESKERR